MFSRSIIHDSRSIIGNSRVMLQHVMSFTIVIILKYRQLNVPSTTLATLKAYVLSSFLSIESTQSR
jgi:hypothetical protein